MNDFRQKEIDQAVAAFEDGEYAKALQMFKPMTEGGLRCTVSGGPRPGARKGAEERDLVQ